MLNTPSLQCRQFRFDSKSKHSGDSRHRHNSSPASQNDQSISVLQYNILADAAIPRGDSGHNICGAYKYCPEESRYMESRHERIIDEVRSLSADLVTLQEIESEHYYESLKTDMKQLGYDSIVHIRYFDHIGLALFYKTSKFELQCDKSFIIHKRVKHLFTRLGLDTKVAHSLEDHMRDSSTYPGILQPPGALMARFLHKATNRILCVATTHITWKEFKYPLLQMLQTSCVIEEMMKFANGYPCILAGDFNTTPDMPLYRMMSSGHVCDNTMNLLISDSRYLDSNMSFHEQKGKDLLTDIKLKLELKSAYLSVMGREPGITSCDEAVVSEDQVGTFKGCLDYIWYSPDCLYPTMVLDSPDESHIDEHVGLPSVIFPSDHLPIYSSFKFK